MRARDIIGRKIVAVEQYPVVSSGCERTWAVGDITLNDGTVLRALTIEVEDDSDYHVQLLVIKPSRKEGE